MKTQTATLSILALLIALSPLAARADFVIADDLIVQGSTCVGLDCVNGEVFGFDTLRLKENNLRILFDDTSASASFPANDWQLTANDSTNGGANKFSIEDITGGRTVFTVEAGAPNHSLYVDDGGRLGLGTSTPVVELHVVDGDTPTLRLEQDGSSGFTPQTWDVAGNEAGFFVRDVTNGSTLPFRVLPGAASEALVVAGDSDVGMGAGTAPQAPLHVKSGTRALGSGNAIVMFEAQNASNALAFQLRNQATGAFWNTAVSFNDDTYRISRSGTGSTELILSANGNLTLSGNCSDAPGGSGCTADHVFEPDYELLSIEKLAEFIAENRHLPNVPSADETRVQGLNLTYMNGRLLEKIEELTLYTIEQHQTLESLQAANQALAERLLQLEARLTSGD